jgi:hypothetical protein
VAIPATASAKSSTSNGAPAVKAHVHKAKKALKKFKVAVVRDNDRVALAQLNSARRQTAAASKIARRMAARAGEGGPSLVAAQSLTLAGNNYDALLEQITALVDEINGRVQLVIAQSIPSVGKQKIIGVLTALLDKVPASARAPLASVITALSIGDATEVTNLDAALGSGTLPSNISGLLSQSLGMASQAIQMAFTTVKSILPLLPSALQGPLGTILDMVSSTLGTIVPGVLATVTGLVDQLLGSLPFVGAGAQGGLGNLLGGILGGGSSPGAGIPDLSGLLAGLFPQGSSGGGPVAGIGGLISSITGMISNLLGGLLGN